MGMLSIESVIDSHRDACFSFMLPYMTHVQGGVVTISCTGGPFAVILTVLGNRRGPLCLQSSWFSRLRVSTHATKKLPLWCGCTADSVG